MPNQARLPCLHFRVDCKLLNLAAGGFKIFLSYLLQHIPLWYAVHFFFFNFFIFPNYWYHWPNSIPQKLTVSILACCS